MQEVRAEETIFSRATGFSSKVAIINSIRLITSSRTPTVYIAMFVMAITEEYTGLPLV